MIDRMGRGGRAEDHSKVKVKAGLQSLSATSAPNARTEPTCAADPQGDIIGVHVKRSASVWVRGNVHKRTHRRHRENAGLSRTRFNHTPDK